ncbi:MAG: FHA domain-containing protein [Planctomycetaceae bacterium]|nr:FHA domain-containing protein [Planctomycetaceae bacterium]
MHAVTVHRAGLPAREVPFEMPADIGRRSECAIQLEDPQVSRTHARIRMEGNRAVLEDLGSVNGTQHNGRKLGPKEVVPLSNGDRISMRPFELVVRLSEAKDITETIATAAPVGSITAPPAFAAARGAAPAVAAAGAPPPPPKVVLPPSPVRSDLVLGRESIPVWSGGKPLQVRVADIIDETHDTKTYRLVGLEPTVFAYKPGQSVQVRVPIEGHGVVKRNYSISSSPARPHAIELTIKRCPGGLVSNWMADNARLGQEFEIAGPYGKFSCFEHPAQKVFLLAAGSGVTPLMSMARWLTDVSADVDIVMLYSVRSPADVIFGRELDYLSARHPSLRVIITSTATRAGVHGWTGIANRVDRGLMRLAAPDLEDREVFMCGPKPFADAMTAEFAALGIPAERVRQESFGGPPGPPKAGAAAAMPAPKVSVVVQGRVAVAPEIPAQPAPPPGALAGEPPTDSLVYDGNSTLPPNYARPAMPTPAPQAAPRSAVKPPAPAAPPSAANAAPSAPGALEVRFARSNMDARTDGSQTLLELGEELGVDLAAGCRSGSCGTCEVHCSEGSVSIEGECFDAPARDGGTLRICVAYPRSHVVLDA